MLISIIGLLAAALTSLSYIPQVKRFQRDQPRTSRPKLLRSLQLDLPCESGMAPQRRFRNYRRECRRTCLGRHANSIRDAG